MVFSLEKGMDIKHEGLEKNLKKKTVKILTSMSLSFTECDLKAPRAPDTSALVTNSLKRPDTCNRNYQ